MELMDTKHSSNQLRAHLIKSESNRIGVQQA